MAIYHLSTKPISRAKGQSAVACAAYRAADKLMDEKYGTLHDYTRKNGVEHSEILLPDHAPAWMTDREKLWNHIEAIENRKDSRLARELEISLPRELTLTQNISLIREFVQQQFVSKGLVADFSIHMEKASDGEKQPHVHVMLVTREIAGDGFGKKDRSLDKKESLLEWRKEWAECANKHLALNGHDLRIDHRSFKEQGIDLEPQKKIGTASAFYRGSSYLEHQEIARENGERLLRRPEIIFDVLTHQQSTFTHHDMARLVNRYTVDSDQFQLVYEKVKASSELVYLGIDDKSRERFTTRTMLKLESEMVASAMALHSKEGHFVNAIEPGSLVEKHQLSPEQSHVLDHITSQGDLKCVVGFAGTGKSRLLGSAKEVWESAGFRVLGATLSGIAAENLEGSSGIDSRTIASRFHYWNKNEELLTHKDILVIDEAGMVDSRKMARLLSEAETRRAKVVLVGDPEQLQAIQAGAAFRAVMERTGGVELSEIWRQNIDWQREATVQFATQRTRDAIGQYTAHQDVHQFDTQSQAKEALVDIWNDARLSKPDKTQIMLAYTRKDTYELNDMARCIRQSLSELGEDHLIVTERGERKFAEGEHIYFLRNDRDLGVKNGTLGTIVDIDGDSLKVSLNKEGMDREQVIEFSAERYNALEYGYAATIHKGQGTTVDRAYVLASQYLDRHATYVAMTRHREGVELYWSKEEFSSYDAMVGVLSRERNKEFSLDYPERDFAAYRGVASEGWPTFESYPVELNKGEALLDWGAVRQDVESRNPELINEFDHRLTENTKLDCLEKIDSLELSSKDSSNWKEELFYGLDKNEDKQKDDFSDLFVELHVDLPAESERVPLDKEIGEDKEMDY